MINVSREVVVDLMRHGACEGGEIFRGTTDVKLSQLGWQQMRDTSSQYSGWQRIVSSPLMRCADYARELAEQHSVPLEIDEQWREVDFGEWEGQSIETVWQNHEAFILRYFTDPGSVTPKGGEPLADALARVATAWERLIHSANVEHILVIHHGGLIRLLLTHILQAPLTAINQFEVNYAALTRVRVSWINGTPVASLAQHYPGTRC